jgi:hypothetical protein
MAASDRERAAAAGAGIYLRGLRLAGAAGLFWLGWGCLNPQPDEYPDSVGTSGVGGSGTVDVVPAPGRGYESCSDNPLLAECGSNPAAGNPASQPPKEGAAGSASVGGDAGSAGAAGAAGAAGSGDLDAGSGSGGTNQSDPGPADAGIADVGRGDADAP